MPNDVPADGQLSERAFLATYVGPNDRLRTLRSYLERGLEIRPDAIEEVRRGMAQEPELQRLLAYALGYRGRIPYVHSVKLRLESAAVTPRLKKRTIERLKECMAIEPTIAALGLPVEVPHCVGPVRAWVERADREHDWQGWRVQMDIPDPRFRPRAHIGHFPSEEEAKEAMARAVYLRDSGVASREVIRALVRHWPSTDTGSAEARAA